MAGYTKLFSRILDSTIWQESSSTRVLWITMLAMANKDGVVEATIPGLADRARIPLKDCELALKRFQQPDKYSWSKEKEGRRIEVTEGGWFLINHDKYRDLLSKEDQREKTRLRVQRWREKKEKNVTRVTGNVSNYIPDSDSSPDSLKPKINGGICNLCNGTKLLKSKLQPGRVRDCDCVVV